MKRLLLPVLMMAFVQALPAAAQPPRQNRLPNLSAAIADGVPFVVQLNAGETNGSLIGGESYSGQYNRDSRTFTVTGMGYAQDGTVTKMTSSWGGANPRLQEITLWGAMYWFDARGNVFLGTSSSGRLSGKLLLSK